MKKVAIIYWSGTGNTEALADAMAEAAKAEGAEVKLLAVDDAKLEDAIEADALGLGCPATGNEELEEDSMVPFVESLENNVQDKPLVLFGSHDWGEGEWMDNWQEQMEGFGAKLLAEPLVVNLDPDEEALEQAKELGQLLAQ